MKILFCLCLFLPAFVWADPIFRVNHGTNQQIDKFSNCKKITNNDAVKDIMVPTNTSGEWSAFLAHLPANVTATTCDMPMIMTWDTTKTSSGSSTATQAKLPLVSSGATYNFVVDWGDGNTDTVTSYAGNPTHTYVSSGIYTIKLTGSFPRLAFASGGDRLKIKDVTQWGNNKWSSMANMFSYCTNLTGFTATDSPDLSGVTDMTNMFQNASAFNGNISSWNTGTVTTMNNMFQFASAFNQSLSSWDVSKVTDMSYMFRYASAFNGNISSWNTGAATNMTYMFYGASAFNQSLSSWDVSKVTDMIGMFWNASAFNQSLSLWDVSKVTDMSYMFSNASVFNGNISSWNTGLVTNMYMMFNNAASFNQSLNSWNVSKVTDMSYMFYGAGAFNQSLNSWNVSKVTKMQAMFQNASAFNGNISSWNTVLVTNMASIFQKASAFNQNISTWNVAAVTDHSSYDTNATVWIAANKPCTWTYLCNYILHFFRTVFA